MARKGKAQICKGHGHRGHRAIEKNGGMVSIKVEPSKIISRLASNRKIKRLFASKGVSLNRAALSFIKEIDFVDTKDITQVALRVIQEYRKRLKGDAEAKKKIKKDPKLLIHRVQNEVVSQLSQGIRKQYAGKKYRWLPSDAEVPDPQHQLKYGKVYTVGVGEMPGDRYGCRCGMEILVDDDKLKI